MTPAIQEAKKAKITYKIHSYTHDTMVDSFGEEAVMKLGVEEGRVFKTLLCELSNKELVVAVLPVSCMLNLKLLAKTCKVKKASLAKSNDVQRSTGYLPGGVSPLGQKKRLRTFIHSSALAYNTLFVSAGKRGLEIELAPEDLKVLCEAEFLDICT